MLSFVPLTTLALSTLATAAPVPKALTKLPQFLSTRAVVDASCTASAADAVPNFPSGQTNLSVPAGQTVEMIAVGRGTQNYTCGSTGTWASAGALATLHDVTCLYSVLSADEFAAIPSVVATMPNPPVFSTSDPNPTIAQIASASSVEGHHYFITEPTGSTPSGLQPKFDFTSTDPSDSSLYVTATKTAFLNDPTDAATNVQWLQLAAISGQGSLASTVFRVDTSGGQPTATCTAGDTSQVDYAALYYFYV